MRQFAIAIATLGILASICSPTFAQRGGRFRNSEGIAFENGWIFDYAKARTLAKKTGKPMMLVFRCVP